MPQRVVAERLPDDGAGGAAHGGREPRADLLARLASGASIAAKTTQPVESLRAANALGMAIASQPASPRNAATRTEPDEDPDRNGAVERRDEGQGDLHPDGERERDGASNPRVRRA
jgi:hypothetical protein